MRMESLSLLICIDSNQKSFQIKYYYERTRLKELPDASDRHRFLAPECDFIL